MRATAIGLGLTALVAVTGLPARAQNFPVSRAVSEANTLSRHKDYAGALAVLDKALAENPKDPVALATRGYVYINLGDYVRATPDFDAALPLVPTSANALEGACWVRALANAELDRALGYCDESLRRAKDRLYEHYDTRGFLRLRRNEFALAVADYDAALKDAPRLASSFYGRGIAKLRLGQDQEGRADLARAVKIEPGIAETYAKRGVVP